MGIVHSKSAIEVLANRSDALSAVPIEFFWTHVACPRGSIRASTSRGWRILVNESFTLTESFGCGRLGLRPQDDLRRAGALL